MNWDSKSIKGEVTAEGFETEIELGSLQFGVGRGIGSPTGAAANREASIPSVSEITVTKQQDESSLKLFEQALAGEDKTVIISFVSGSVKKLGAYCTITLSDTMISGYSLSSGGDRPTESLSLNFTKIEYKFDSTDAEGTATPANTTYDIALGKIV